MNTERIDEYLEKLFPLCRSLTGDGNRQSLEILSEITPLEVHEVPSGKDVYDWTIPPEWNISEAYIEAEDGTRVVEFSDSNLHVVNYSEPVDKTVSYDELGEHVHTLPEKPDAIPYRTSYYDRDWGFCLRHSTWESLDSSGDFRVCIDSTLDPDGSLTYADAVIEGESNQEYFLTTYCCHPSLANDNLSGLLLATLLFEWLRERSTYHSYRLVIAPETIGTIAYLHEHEEAMKHVDGGYVITTVAGPGTFDYKESFETDHPVDIAANKALSDYEYEEHEFSPTGSDERQFSSPGFRLATGTIAKNKYYEYDEYHTSDDNLSFISAESLKQTLERYLSAIEFLEMNRTYTREEPHCEFKLDRHGLHPTTGGQQNQNAYLDSKDHGAFEYSVGTDEFTSGRFMNAISWLMFGCDGNTSMFQLSERSDMDVYILHAAAKELKEAGLVSEVCQ